MKKKDLTVTHAASVRVSAFGQSGANFQTGIVWINWPQKIGI